jgi:hypothetical protein
MTTRLATAAWLAEEVHAHGIVAESPLWPVLLDTATDPRASTPRRKLAHRRLKPEPWWPLTTAMELLLFADHDELAAQLCERTIAEHASTPGSRLANYNHPFHTVLLAATRPAERLPDPAVDPGDPHLQRLRRVLDHLDPSSVLARGLSATYHHGHERALRDMLSGDLWEPPGEVLQWGNDLAARLDDLDEEDSQNLWAAAQASRHEGIGHQLHERYGLTSPLWYVNAWYAGVQVRDGDLDGARETLTWALQHVGAQAYHVSEVLPLDLTLQETLRLAATPAFRAQLLADLPARLPWEGPARRAL